MRSATSAARTTARCAIAASNDTPVIRALHLCKSYRAPTGEMARALDDVSFQIARGEVVGLLGANGAGKSTLMRILTCFLAPTSGAAEVNGHAIAGDTRAVRRAIGYLPETAALYPDMRVTEYLHYRAALKGVPRAARAGALARVLDQCDLGAERTRIIGTLSRGYRQRVGLADALLADPPVLILDEPTVGLDPHQRRQVRALIQALGRERTVVLSTHILPEAAAVATRVLILHAGRVVADQAPSGPRRVLLDVRREQQAAARAALAAAADVASVAAIGADTLAITLTATPAAADVEARERVFRLLVAAGVALHGLRTEALALEDIFTRVTGAGGSEPDPRPESVDA
jgi:ABC-2 type transport system ATP-binding protein